MKVIKKKNINYSLVKEILNLLSRNLKDYYFNP